MFISLGQMIYKRAEAFESDVCLDYSLKAKFLYSQICFCVFVNT